MTGMRRGEVYGRLRWSDVDLDRGRIEVRQQRLAISHKLVFAERTKTDRGRRTIGADPGTVAVLRAQRALQAGYRLRWAPATRTTTSSSASRTAPRWTPSR